MPFRLRTIAPVTAALLLLFTRPGAAAAQDMVRDTIPHRWVEPMLPEDLPALEQPAYYTDLEKARSQAFGGRYKLALMTLQQIKTTKPGDAAAVALIKAESLAATGRKEQAIEVLSAAEVRDNPKAQVRRGRILAALGRTDEALSLLKDHLKAHPDSLAGHFYLGQISERVGDLDAARAAYTWFNDKPQDFLLKWQGKKDKAFDSAEDVVLIGRAYDRLASLDGLYEKNPQLHKVLLEMFVRAYDVIDRTYWPAHVAAAEYFLSHDNSDEAVKELKAAAGENPNDVRTLQLLGLIALEQFNFDGADAACSAIRHVDGHAIEADIVETRNLLQQRRPKDAEHAIQLVLDRQPNNIEALGLLAACYALQLKDAETAKILKRVDEIDVGHDNATAYFDVAEQLGAMRQYPRSAEKYQVAIDRAPWWTAPRNGQGLLYTQSGDEDKAKSVLDAAHTLDPFNLRTTNYLRLLDEMATFARKETAHFVVFYDPKDDPMIPEYFGEYLESIHAAVCGEYHTEPPVKTYIEVFPSHDAFSVRTTGTPYIGTVGASTGRVIALVSPRKGRKTMGTYNWALVLRHEYTHTVTLAATDNRIPHWMTEGLAVMQEHTPLRWEWVPMLYNAVKTNTLFTVENLTWGFVRPKRPIDRQLAYAESFWVCTYIEEKWGHDAILRMLNEFRSGGLQEDVFPKVLGKSLSDFTNEFFAWTQKQVAGWGYDEETDKKYDELKEQGEDLIKAHQYDAAVPIFEQIAKLRPMDALPHQRLAGLYLTREVNQPAKALEQLITLNKVEIKDNRYSKRIARLCRDLGETDKAVNYARQSVYIDPYDMDAHELLAQLYEKADNQTALARERRVIPELAEWLDAQKKLTEIPDLKDQK